MKQLLLIAATLLSAHLAHALEVGDQAPCVVLNQIAVNGQEAEHCIRDPKIKGQVVVQEFFSVTCSDCLDSFMPVNQIAAELEATSTFRLISLDRNEMQVRGFIAANRAFVTHEVALDTERAATKAYGVVQTPTIFVLNPQNKIVFKHEGVVTAQVAQAIKKAVQTAK